MAKNYDELGSEGAGGPGPLASDQCSYYLYNCQKFLSFFEQKIFKKEIVF